MEKVFVSSNGERGILMTNLDRSAGHRRGPPADTIARRGFHKLQHKSRIYFYF